MKMNKETIVAVSDTTKEFMESINEDVCGCINSSIEQMGKSVKCELNNQLEASLKLFEKNILRKLKNNLSVMKETKPVKNVENESNEMKEMKKKIIQLEENDKKKTELIDRLVEQNQKLLEILEELMEG